MFGIQKKIFFMFKRRTYYLLKGQSHFLDWTRHTYMYKNRMRKFVFLWEKCEEMCNICEYNQIFMSFRLCKSFKYDTKDFD